MDQVILDLKAETEVLEAATKKQAIRETLKSEIETQNLKDEQEWKTKEEAFLKAFPDEESQKAAIDEVFGRDECSGRSVESSAEVGVCDRGVVG